MKFCSKLVWWYWALTTILLVGVLAGYSLCIQAVIALNIVQVVHFIIREKSISAFPVQVRIVYLGLLIVAQAPYMVWIFWWQLIGTSAMIPFGYCFLARLLSLYQFWLSKTDIAKIRRRNLNESNEEIRLRLQWDVSF